MSRVIVHIDLNYFFVRAEEIKDPSLINKPVAIGHLGRAGIVSTCSYKAREYGVRSGQPMNVAVKLCKDLIIVHGDYHYYSTLSHQFKKIIKSYTPLVEEASIDEVYADFTEQIKGVKDVNQYFKDLQKRLFDETKLYCSIGIGPTKFLAKMGSDYKKPNGITIIRKRDIPNILYPLKVDDTFGIGKKTAPRLHEIGIHTIGDLKKGLDNSNPKLLSVLGSYSDYLLPLLNGNSSDEINLEPFDPKSIGSSTTLEEDTTSLDVVFRTFNVLAKEVSLRVKSENKVGNTIQIMVKDHEYKAHNKSITFDKPTDDATVIYNYATKLYEKNYPNLLVRAVGVTLQNLVDKKEVSIQMTIFDYEEYIEKSQTKLLINDINRKLKKPILKRLSEVKKNVNK